jgi:hypothetical protein
MGDEKGLPPALSRRAVLAGLAVLPAASGTLGPAAAQAGPLPSWNDGPAKQAIFDFVRATIDRTSRDYVPTDERIAVFDQDGTLWVEHPIYTQFMFCLDRVPAVAAQKPALKNTEPFKTVLSGNREAIAKLSAQDFEKIAVATLTGMTVEQFGAEVRAWLERAAPAVEQALHRSRLPADARGPGVPAQQRVSDLHRDRRRPGLRADLRAEGLRRPARAGRRHRARDQVRSRQGRQA